VDDSEVAIHANQSPAEGLEEGADAIENVVGTETWRGPLP
jgi:hypothetical protein